MKFVASNPVVPDSMVPFCFALLISLGLVVPVHVAKATPENRAALEKHFGKFLTEDLKQCTTCHLPSENKNPEKLEDFPHNPFGARLRVVGQKTASSGKKKDISERLKSVAQEDADGDGVNNLTELLLGHAPGVALDKPSVKKLAGAKKAEADFEHFLKSYRWKPFETVVRPEVPKVKTPRWVRNPIDAFVAAEHEARKLRPRPQAPKRVLLRRIYLDLIGLSPTPDEMFAFQNDKSPDAYEKVVDRLLADPRYGERWGRHWMDVWRYSDWGGYNQEVRDSKPHIWRWRDWIVDSLNEDKGYDKMLMEMLAADELFPDNTNAVRATGFLARNYKMLSREQWLTDTIQHTSKAFLGLTVNCAKCHDHKYDPISQEEYFQMRAIFETHHVRTDRVPGQYDIKKDGLVRVYDVATNSPTYILYRGDERSPETNRLILPGVPAAFGGSLKIDSVKLPRLAAFPNRREFVVRDEKAAGEKAIVDAREALEKWNENKSADAEKQLEAEVRLSLAEARQAAYLAASHAEDLEEQNKKDSDEWREAATNAVIEQRRLAVLEARQELKQLRDKEIKAQEKATNKTRELEDAEKNSLAANQIALLQISAGKAEDDFKKAKQKTADTEKKSAEAEKEITALPTTAYKPSSPETFPQTSTGRRLAFARWVSDMKNPLTARVAMNHIWLRHFDQALVSTPSDFGRNGREPTHPRLLDWLAAEFMAQNWSMKAMHRLIVTSSVYRMSATPGFGNEKTDPENLYLWRMPSKRMEAEVVRDNVLYVCGNLDSTFGGPEIPAAQGLVSTRRSIYLRNAPEKQVEFLRIFDGPDVTECYARKSTVMPHQALALANSEIVLAQSQLLAGELFKRLGDDENKFVFEAFLRVLAREPNKEELRSCTEFLQQQESWLFSNLADKKEIKPVSKVSSSKTKATKTGATESKAPSPPTLRAREDLVLVLFNHNDFVTIR